MSERIRLRDRLNDLRAEAAALRGGAVAHLTDEQLASEIRSTHRQLEAIRSGRFDTSMVGGATGLGGGLDPMQVARHNQRVDAEGGRADLERRLGELRREAARRR